MVREIGVQSQVGSYQRLKKMVLDTSLLNTQHYKVRIKSKLEQSPYTSVYRPPLHLGVVAIEKGTFGPPSTMVANLYIYIYIYIYILALIEIVWLIGFPSIGRTTILGEGKTLNSKPEECCSGKSVAHCWTILLLSASPRSLADSTNKFTTIKKSHGYVVQQFISFTEQLDPHTLTSIYITYAHNVWGGLHFF